MKKEVKRLHKSETDRKLAGVLGGLAEYLDLDPTFVRAGYVLLTFFTAFFPGIVAYVVLAAIMPTKSEVSHG